MADDEQTIKRIARETAREIIAELQNEHGLITLPEAQQLAQIEGRSQFYCSNCGYEFSDETVTAKACPKCGNTKAQPNPVFRCARCNRPVDRGMVSCPSCGTKEAVRAERSMEV